MMNNIEFEKLSWPRKMNLDILQKYLTEQQMKQIIVDHCRERRVERRIQLPSIKCMKKVIFYYLVKKCGGNYKLVMEELKGNFKFLKQLGLERCNVRRLFLQRQKEIGREKEIKNEQN